MKIKQFRLILALAVVTASLTTSLSPAQAFTWEDAWNAIKRGYENAPSQQQSNNETPQTGGFSNDTPQPQITPQPQTTPQQNNYSAPSPPPRQPRRAFRSLQTSCVKASGSDITGIGRDDSDSIVSVGQRAVSVSAKTRIYANTPLQMTCAITRHPTDEKVRLALAIPDNSGLETVRVSIYVDGQEKFSKIMSRGQVRQKDIDITGASSYAYILQPIGVNLYGDNSIYFPSIRQPRPAN